MLSTEMLSQIFSIMVNCINYVKSRHELSEIWEGKQEKEKEERRWETMVEVVNVIQAYDAPRRKRWCTEGCWVVLGWKSVQIQQGASSMPVRGRCLKGVIAYGSRSESDQSVCLGHFKNSLLKVLINLHHYHIPNAFYNLVLSWDVS